MPEETKYRKMTIRMTDAEYKQIERKAAEYGLSVSDYMRLVGKTAIIETKIIDAKPK